jgi:hypothetical protein
MIAAAADIALLAAIARGIDRMVQRPDESRATRATRILLWGSGALIVVEAALGAIGQLQAYALFGVLFVAAIVMTALTWRRPAPAPATREPLSPVEIGLAAALTGAVLISIWIGWHRTTFLYDTLSYHLHVPATWAHDRRISIVPAVFGDPSSAYAPSNLELVFTLLLMRPAYSAALGVVGQAPFAALAAAAIVAGVREAGGRRAPALAAALAFLLIPEVWGQIGTAMTDLGLAAFLLAALPFARRLWRAARPDRRDLFPFATAIGLAIGTKYAGATLALPLGVLGAAALARPGRRVRLTDAALAATVAIATGGFWYLRNLAVTGNPFYPVAVPGLPLPALYGGAEMRAWDYHVPIGNLAALGAMLIAAGVGFASAAAVAIARLWRSVEAALLLALLVLFWFVVPYQESRFLFAALGVAAIALGRAADRPPAVVGACGLAIAIVGALLQAPTPERLVLVPIAAVTAAAALPWRWLAYQPSRLQRGFVSAAAAGALLLAVAVGAARFEPRFDVGDDGLADAWAWFRAREHHAPAAYTGTNLAFPLWDRQLLNRVGYVNVAGAPGDRLHDFGPPGDGSAEPAPYRRGANPDVWLANLRAMRTEELFVASLDPIVRRTVAADADGFPIERAWADARPGAFRLIYSSPAARIYKVSLW